MAYDELIVAENHSRRDKVFRTEIANLDQLSAVTFNRLDSLALWLYLTSDQ